MIGRHKPKFEGKLRLKKGDEVIVLAGKDKGKQGKILHTVPEEGKVIVDGINIVTRHQRPRSTGRATPAQQMGTVQKPAPMPIGKVMLICPKCSKETRTATGEVSGNKGRVCKKCHELIDA